jgi:hypothetical protein
MSEAKCTCLKITKPGWYHKLDADCPIHAPSKMSEQPQKCPGPRQHGHPLQYESHCEHGQTGPHQMSEQPHISDGNVNDIRVRKYENRSEQPQESSDEWKEWTSSEQPHPSDGSMTAKQVEWEMSEQSQEWTVCPVIEASGKEWVGLSYIRCGTRTWGSMNTEVAKALCKDIKAALAAKDQWWDREVARPLRNKLAAEREKTKAFHKNWPKVHKAIRSDIMLSEAAEEIHALSKLHESLARK